MEIENSPPPGKLHDTLARSAFPTTEKDSAIKKILGIEYKLVRE
jgi:hypothetical protein